MLLMTLLGPRLFTVRLDRRMLRLRAWPSGYRYSAHLCGRGNAHVIILSYPCTLTPFATQPHTQSLEDQLKHRDHEWVELEAKLLETQTKYSREKEAQKRYSR